MPEDVYTTRDLTRATYLVVQGHDVELAPIGPHTVQFRFPRTEPLGADVRKFNTGRARIEPRDYHETMIDLRRRIETTLEEAQKGGSA